jgi:predicted double-glycine peptidase
MLLLLQPRQAPPTSLWINVPFVAQPRDGCGAASVAMVMKYWAAHSERPGSVPEQVATIQKQVYSAKLHGATPSALEDYLQHHGYLTFALQGSWSDIERQIGKGRPLIVALRPSGQRELHYVVIDGIDTERNLILINDPELRKLMPEGRRQFEKEWRATHQWMLLALPHQPNS